MEAYVKYMTKLRDKDIIEKALEMQTSSFKYFFGVKFARYFRLWLLRLNKEFQQSFYLNIGIIKFCEFFKNIPIFNRLIKAIIKVLLGVKEIIWNKTLKRIVRKNEVENADVLFISFPKCGRTWLRLLIGRSIQLRFNIMEGEEILKLGKDLSELDDKIPFIHVFHEDNPHFKRPDELEVSKEKYKNKKIIFMVRDPRDVLISNYFQEKKRQRNFNGSLTEFINSEIGSIDTILKYYSIWAKNKKIIKDLILVKYEDLHKDAGAELKKVLNFIGLDNVSSKHISQAVEYAKFENMRKMEKKGKFKTPILQAVDKDDKSSYKTRKGEVGDYKNHLTEQQRKRIDQKIEKMLGKYDWYQTYLN